MTTLAGNSRRARRYSLPLLDADIDDDFEADVVDLCARVQRCGHLNTDEAYAPASDDSWRAFCNRHGSYGFDWSWEKQAEAERVARIAQAYEARRAERRREARITAKLQADQDWWESQQRPAPVKPKPKQWNGVTYHWYQRPPPAIQNVEPWFRPDHVLTRDDVHQITLYAVNYFAAARRVRPLGVDATVTTRINIECARDADAIAGALYPLATSLPAAMRFAWIGAGTVGVDQVRLEVCFG